MNNGMLPSEIVDAVVVFGDPRMSISRPVPGHAADIRQNVPPMARSALCLHARSKTIASQMIKSAPPVLGISPMGTRPI